MTAVVDFILLPLSNHFVLMYCLCVDFLNKLDIDTLDKKTLFFKDLITLKTKAFGKYSHLFLLGRAF